MLRNHLFPDLLKVGLLCMACMPVAVVADVADVAIVPQPEPSVSIQDLMKFEVDPAADYLWESVGSVVTESGTETRMPRTDTAWYLAEREAVILLEAANLLLMDGRRITLGNKKLEDEGEPGVLGAREAQAAIDADRAGFNAFAAALRAVALEMRLAAESQDPVALMNAGDSLDAVCEGCHLQFWYPNQVIPEFPQSLSGQHTP